MFVSVCYSALETFICEVFFNVLTIAKVKCCNQLWICEAVCSYPEQCYLIKVFKSQSYWLQACIYILKLHTFVWPPVPNGWNVSKFFFQLVTENHFPFTVVALTSKYSLCYHTKWGVWSSSNIHAVCERQEMELSNSMLVDNIHLV